MELVEIAKQLFVTNVVLKEDERVLVVTDDEKFTIGMALYQAAKDICAHVSLIVTPPAAVAGAEPDDCVTKAMERADVVLCPTAQSMTHTNASLQAAALGARVVTMPGITEEMFCRGAMTADYSRVEKLSTNLAHRLSQANWAKLVTNDLELHICLEGRSGVASTGVFRCPGSRGNLPSGEAYIAPQEGRSWGRVRVDGSMVGIGQLKSPLEFTVQDGVLQEIRGVDKDKLEILMQRPENGNLCELGIGTNSGAQLCGLILEDEKIYGTVHVAFGTNISFGGVTKADCHLDGVITCPDLWLDDEQVICKGAFLINLED